LPYFHREGFAGRTMERAREIFAAISRELPRFYITPVVVGFCMLVRRHLVDNHGLFDVAYGAGYNEENDFCLRVNALGYSALLANHALALHVGSTSFGSDTRDERDALNSALLIER